MAESSDRAVELPFSKAIDAMMAACQVAPEAKGAFIARVRHLQRLGLPPRGGAPANARLTYGLAEIAAVATAFRLMAAFLLPTLAARYVLERWTDITPFLLAGSAEAMPEGYARRRPPPASRYLVLAGAALTELGRKAAHEGRYDGALGEVTLLGDVDAAAVAAAAGGAGVVVDAAAFMPAIIAAVRSHPLVEEEDVEHELERLRLSRAVPYL